MTRCLLALSLCAAFFLAAPAGAGAGFHAGTCIDRSEPSVKVPTDGDPFEFHAMAGGDLEATRFRDALRASGAWNRFRSETGLDGFMPGQAPPVRFYVQSGLAALGSTNEYCTGATELGVLIRRGLDTPTAAATAAHETFHLFQADASSRVTPNAWVDEATAEWATAELGLMTPKLTADRDAAFTQKPHLPLTSTAGTHEYGALRFMQWLDRRLAEYGYNTWKLTRATYERIGAGVDATEALDERLKARAVDLREELGVFWGDQLRETPRVAPQTRGESYDMEVGNQTVKGSAAPLAASVVRMNAPPGARRIVISGEPPADGTFLWVLDGDGAPVEWRHGGRAVFCVKGSEEGAVRWPGQFAFAFTNGKSGPSAQRFRASVETDGCKNKKKAPVKGPGGFVPSLPKRCPPAPPNFAAPAPRTSYWVFGERFTEVVRDLSYWSAALNRRYASRAKRAKASAPWIRCAAKRARGIDAAPDEQLRLGRLDYASRLELAADGARRADVPWMIEHLNAAGQVSILIAGRVASQDQNPENAGG